MTALARVALMSLVSFGVCVVSAPIVEASSSCAKKKKKKKAAKKVSAASPKAVTADTLLKWRRAGMTDDEIAARAVSAGYRLSEKDKAKLKKAKARTLVGVLEGSDPGDADEPEEMIAAEPKPAPSAKPININNITSPEDIDFDDVPPPPGTPKQYAKKEPEKPKRDTSLRPAAPFDEEKPAQVAAVSKSNTPKKSAQPAPSSSSSSDGKKRVVYTAAAQ